MEKNYINLKQYLMNFVVKKKEDCKIPAREWLYKKFHATPRILNQVIEELILEGYLMAMDGVGSFIKGERCIERMRNWGVILPSISENIYPNLIKGIEEFTSKSNIDLIICNTGNDPLKQEQHTKNLIGMGVEGCIFVPCINVIHNDLSFEYLEKTKTPYVFCNRGIEGSDKPLITSNSFQGTYLATQYLIKQGRINLAFVSMKRYSTSFERYLGFATAMKDAGMPLEQDLIIHENYEGNDYKERIKQIFKSDRKPDGIVCFNDVVSSLVYEVVQDEKLAIGKDISVVGYDNSLLSQNAFPKLTSVDYRARDIGYEAAKILAKMMEDSKNYEYYVKVYTPSLVIRNS